MNVDIYRRYEMTPDGLRFEAASRIMAACLSTVTATKPTTVDEFAAISVRAADALLVELERTSREKP